MNHAVQYDATLASKYSGEERLEHPQNFLPYDTWLRAVGDVQGQTVFDLACGSGVSSRLLAERGAQVTGIDISQEMVEIARAKQADNPKGIVYQLHDCTKPFPPFSNYVDLVSATFLFNYAASKQELFQMMMNAHHCLKIPGRLVALTTPQNPIIPKISNASHSSEWIDEPFREGSRFRLFLYNIRGQEICNIVCYHWNQETYEQYLYYAGFRDFKWYSHQATPELKKIRELARTRSK